MAQHLRTLDQLIAHGLVEPAADTPALRAVAARYAVALTPAVVAAVAGPRPSPAVARQYLPSPDELVVAPEELADPTCDAPFSPVPGIVHRHRDRVLLKLLTLCPVYCRFCFRRETVGHQGAVLPAEQVEAALGYIREHSEIWEVILTGGDPLALSPRRLSEVLQALRSVPHVEVIRIHSRVPVVAPERLSQAMAEALAGRGAALWVALHVNHADELTADALAAIARLIGAGAALVGQTVLLRGVNDTAQALEDLYRALVRARVKPYYLHHCDLAPGTGHFRTSIAHGRTLMESLRQRASGLCQPTYVLDLPDGGGKVPIGPDYAQGDDERGWRLRGLDGQPRAYPPRPGS